jgi:hypothetical protein
MHLKNKHKILYLVVDNRYDTSYHSNQISDMIFESYLELYVHARVSPEPKRNGHSQSYRQPGDLANYRRKISQFEGSPHAHKTTKPIIPINFYIVLASNPQGYAEAKGNLYWKTSMNEGDFDHLPYDWRKWIDTDILLVNLLHHIHIYIYIFNKNFIEQKLAHL